MSQKFPVGTVVYLKTGSPPLIVNGLRRTDDVVSVEWFVGGALMRDAFDVECLFEETPQLAHMRQQRMNAMQAMLIETADTSIIQVVSDPRRARI